MQHILVIRTQFSGLFITLGSVMITTFKSSPWRLSKTFDKLQKTAIFLFIKREKYYQKLHKIFIINSIFYCKNGADRETWTPKPSHYRCAALPIELCRLLAEWVGFEPTDPLGSLVFKTSAISRSAITPIKTNFLITVWRKQIVSQLHRGSIHYYILISNSITKWEFPLNYLVMDFYHGEIPDYSQVSKLSTLFSHIHKE